MRQALKRAVAFLLAAGCVSAAYAVSVQTQSIPGGWVWRLAQSTTSTNVMYTAAYTVHRSTDNGRTWVSKPFFTELTTDGEGKQIIPYMNCTRLAIKADDANTVVAGDISSYSGNALFRTTNGGDTWGAITLADSSGSGVNVVANSLSNPNNFFAVTVPCNNDSSFGGSTTSKLFKSADGGATWNATAFSVDADNFTINDVLQLPDGTVVTAVTTGIFRDNLSTVPSAGTIYCLDNNGTQTSSTAIGWAPVRLTWDPTNSRLWGTSEAGDLYYSTDSGLTWTKYTTSAVSVFVGDCVPLPVVYFPGTTPALYVGGETGTGPTMYRQ
jgi:hypothetical protein